MGKRTWSRLSAAVFLAGWIGVIVPAGVEGQTAFEKALVGSWSGSLTLVGTELPFSVRLFIDADTLSGTMAAQGVTDLALTEVGVTNGTLHFARSGPAGVLAFSGVVNGDSIQGTVSQGTIEGTFQLTRTDGSAAGESLGAPRAAIAPSERNAGGGDGTGRLRSCRLPGLADAVSCGSYRVPENREHPADRTIDLNLVVLPALDSVADSIPLVVLAGGPGGAATQMAPALGLQFPDLREHFDIILVDQRGTGASNPLQCTYRNINEMARATLQVDFDSTALAACRDGWDADPSQYGTAVAMDDLAEVVQALGHPRINVYGLSYGTRAALVLARRHPSLVRALVLQGVAPLSLTLPLSVARDAQAALDGVFHDCAADGECDAAFPDLDVTLRAVLAELARAPQQTPITDPVTGQPGRLEITQDIFTGGLRSLLYANAFIQSIPGLVHAAGQGDYAPFAQAVLPLVQAFGQTLYFGAYLSVVCTEDIPYIDSREARASTRDTFLGDRMVRHHRNACRGWPRGRVPDGFRSPVTVATPTLLISGTSDPVTPPRWGEVAARNLPNSLHLVVPKAGHADSVGPCEQGIAAVFLQAGSLHGLDTSCVAAGRERRYVPPR